MGSMLHVDLKGTADTISAGQANAEKGVETSWLAPTDVPSDAPGECILHRAKPSTSSDAWNHVVWEGQHEVLNTEIVSNTPEIRDGQSFKTIRGPYCATAGCGCSLRKLSDAVAEKGFPGAAAEEGQEDSVAEDLVAQQDPCHVEVARQALHSLAGGRCD